MAQARSFKLLLAATMAMSACAHSHLVKSGDAMVRAERGTEGVVAEVLEFKDATIKSCRAQDLLTPEARAECADPAVKAVELTEASVETIKAALVSFWTLYPILEAKFDSGERPSAAELAELATSSAAVLSAFQGLVKAVKEAKK